MSELLDLSGKVALVTGGSRGIGYAIAHILSMHGAAVAICSTRREASEEAAMRLSSETHGVVKGFQANVADSAQAGALIAETAAAFGKVDFLVNNAGITRDGLLLKMTEQSWDDVMSVNLKGVFNVCKAVIQPMMRARYGRIVNISSIVGLHGNAGQTNYAAAKAGIIGFTKSLAKEIASRNIRVNAVAPGYVDTDMTAQLKETVRQALVEAIPLKRTAAPEDIANVVLFLLSDMSNYMTGQVLEVDGGLAL